MQNELKNITVKKCLVQDVYTVYKMKGDIYMIEVHV